MNQKFVIIGGGGHTRVLIGMLKRAEAPIHGIITADAELLGLEIHGVPVLGLEHDAALKPNEVVLINGVGNKASRDGSGLDVRAGVYTRYHAQGFAFPPIISTQAIVQPDITLGAGVQIMPGAIVQPGAMIGENAIINTGAIIEHDAVIAPHAHIAPGAIICGGASVGEATHIGAGAVVLQGITIGSRAVVGAGAVVRRPVADGEILR